VFAAVAVVGFLVGNTGVGVTWSVLGLILVFSAWLRRRGQPQNPARSLTWFAVGLGIGVVFLGVSAAIEGERELFGLAVIVAPLFVFTAWGAVVGHRNWRRAGKKAAHHDEVG
jgi:hypothetical protein